MALNIISNVQLDMKAPNTVIVYANQYDSAGSVKAQLLNSGESWSVPAGAKAVVMFKKSDNIGGFYDVTEFGVAAVEIDSDRSIIYINYDPQVLTTAGRVAVQINFYQNDQRLSSFAFYTDVQASAVTSGEIASSWLFNILSQEIAQTLTVATTPQAMTDWLEANITQETGYVIDNTLTVAGAASDAQATGKMVTVSNLNPNTVANKVWVKKTPATLEIPTMEDVDEVKSALTFDEYLINSGAYTIKADDLESGQWSFSTKADNPARARTKNLLPVRAGMTITYANTTFDTYFGVLDTPTSGRYIQTFGWKIDGSGTVNITNDGYLTFVIRNHADTSATVNLDDYDSTVVISTKVNNDIYAGRNATVNMPKVLTFFSTASLESFGLSDMPNMSYTYTTTISKFTDLPEDFPVTSGYGIHIEKLNLNNSGLVSMAVVIDPGNNDVKWVARVVSGETLQWRKCVTRSEFDALKAQADASSSGIVSLGNAVSEHNTINIPYAFSTYETHAERGGVEYTLNEDGQTYTIDGEVSAATWVNVIGTGQSLIYLRAGATYDFVLNKTEGSNIIAVIYYVVSDKVDYDHPTYIYTSKTITLPNDFTGCLVHIIGPKVGTVYDNCFARLQILSTENNLAIDKLTDAIIDISTENNLAIDKLTDAIIDIEETYAKDQHISRIDLWPYVNMDTYEIDDGAVVMSNTKIKGSKYIKCPKWLVTRFGAMDKTGDVNLFAQNSTPASSATINGITFALNADKNEYTINGINTGNYKTPSYVTIMTSAQSTKYLEAGKSYYVKVSGDCDVLMRIYYKVNGSVDYDHPKDFKGNGVLKLKSDFSGCLIRAYTNWNTQYTDAKFHFEMLMPSTYVENNDPRIYMYFYNLVNGAYVRNDSILYHVTSNNDLNKFSPATLGNRVLEIPDGTYMQISDPTGQDFEVYGWDGEHVGAEICGNAYSATVYNKNETTVLLPGNATMVFSKSFATKAVYGEPKGIPDALDLVYSNNGNTGRMCVTLPSGYNFFVVRCQKIVPLTANTTYVTMLNAVYNGNLNDEISCICGDVDYCTVPSLRATKAIKAAEAITGGIKWTALKQMTGFSAEYAYYKDVLYTGTPYVSVWFNPNELGYHISKQTFINAANDLDSAFYNESSYRNQSPGYGLVCTTFAELCNGWPYPIVTNALGYHPDVVVQYTDDLIPGMMLWNDAGHVVLPEMVLKAGNTQEYIVYEGVNPSTTRIARLDTRHDPNFYTSGNGTFTSYEYLHKYIYACTHKSAKGYPYGMYNIYAGMLINGSARPYRGDRSVMTNLSGVKINIKDANATKLYLQKCTRNMRITITEPADYLGDSFIKTDDAPIEIDITGTQMTIDPSLLTDGAFYGCYTDTDSTMEYFEYHAVTAGTYSKTGSNFVFDVDRPFWYAIFDKGTEQISGVEMWVSIPYVSSGDYSKYRQALNPAENVAAVAFVKGTLGAYVIPLTEST